MKKPTAEQLLAENAELRARLDEAEQTLSAIRCGEVDAVVVSGPKGEQIFSLVGAESIYRLIVETMKEAAFTVTFDGTILFCNSQFGQFVQRPMEQIVGRRLHEFVAPDNVASADSLLTLSGKQPVKQRLVLWNSQKQPVPVHISANVLNQSGGPSICIVASDLTELENSTELIQQLRRQQEALRDSRIAALNLMQDAVEARRQAEQANENLRQEITERKQAEEKLRESETRLQLTLQASAVGTFEVDLTTGVGRWNVVEYELLGLRPGDVPADPETFFRYVHPQDVAELRARWEEATRTGRLDAEFRVVRANGQERWLAGKGQFVFAETADAASAGGKRLPLRFLGVNFDITERKQAEEALAASERNYRQLIETANSIIIRWDNQGIIRFINDYGLRFFGYAAEELLDRDVMTIVPKVEASTGRDLDALVKDIVVHPEQYTYVPSENLRKDGATAWVAWTNKAILDEQGNVREILAIGNDITELKQAEAAVAAAHRQVQSIIDNTTSIVYAFDLEERFVMANITLAELLNSTPEQMIGKRRHEFMPQEDADWHEGNDRQVIEAGRALEFEEHSQLPGRSITWLTTKFPLRDAQGRIYAVAGISADVSARKQTEMALRESEARFRSVLDHSRDVIYRLNLQTGRYEYISPSAETVVGYSPEELKAQDVETALAMIHPDDLPALRAGLARLDETGQAKVEYRQRAKSGDYRWLSNNMSLTGDGAGRPLYRDGNIRDVTERKRAEEALRETRDYLDNLFNYANAPIIVWDPQFRITRFNAAFEHLTGRPAREVLGREIDVLFPPDSREESLAHIRRTTSQRERWEVIEIRILHTSGDVRTVLWNSANVLASDHETVIATIAQGQDITERKQAEETLRNLNATLESKVAQRTAQLQQRARQLQKMTLEVSLAEDRERKRMAEILHDDLQQIIAGAKFHLTLLRNRVKHDASLHVLGSQIDEMLKDAIEKSRGLSHELSPAILHHSDFTETLGWLGQQMQAKHGLVVQVCANGPSGLQSEAVKSFLYKAAQELLFNVVKHARVTEARLRFRRCGPYACLAISDRGRGFDPQGLRETAGFGLLSIRERIELLGGRMKIKSAPGQGSTFSIVVPDSEEVAGLRCAQSSRSRTSVVGEERENGHADSQLPAADHRAPLRVLLADDHRIVREGLRSLLREEPDVEIVGEAAHGREAVDLALRLEPDVVIMDVSMPLIDGDAATRQIKAHLPQTRVIALSTYNEPATIQKMYQAGAEGYVLKTASSAELLAAIWGREPSS